MKKIIAGIFIAALLIGGGLAISNSEIVTLAKWDPGRGG